MKQDKEDKIILGIMFALVFFWLGVVMVGFYVFKVDELLPRLEFHIYKESGKTSKRRDSTYLEI